MAILKSLAQIEADQHAYGVVEITAQIEADMQTPAAIRAGNAAVLNAHSREAEHRNREAVKAKVPKSPETVKPGTRHDPRAWPHVRRQFRSRFAIS